MVRELNGRRRYVYGKTRTEVAHKLGALTQQLSSGLPLPSGHETVASFLATWLEGRRSQLRPAPWRRSEEYVRIHIVPVIGHVKVSRLTPQHLTRPYEGRLRAGLSSTSVHHLHATLHTALGLHRRQYEAMQRRPNITPNAITAWCVETFGSGPAATLFEGGYLSQVVGVELFNGRRIVVKAREWQDRLVACAQVQRALLASGFPAPELLVGPDRWGDGYALSAEQLVEGGGQAPDGPGVARRFAEGLALLVRSAPSPSDIGTLAPSPPWVGWDRADLALWPEPDDRDGDLNAHEGDPWLDDIAQSARARLLGIASPCVVGHGDYYSGNLQWHGDELLAVHDWDSVVAQPEAAIVGQAAAVWPVGEVATIEQTEEFLDSYLMARGAVPSKGWIEDSWAAGLWARAFEAKKASLGGEDPFLILTPTEAQERMQRAGLSTNQVNW